MFYIKKRNIIKKRGISLIEVLIAIGVISTLFCMILNITAKCNSIFFQCIKNNKENYYVYEAFNFISNRLDSSNNIDIENNIISINLTHNSINEESLVNKNIIKFDSNQKELIVLYYKDNDYKKTNVILKNASNFEVLQKDSVVYITIYTKDGRKFERCLGIRRRDL